MACYERNMHKLVTPWKMNLNSKENKIFRKWNCPPDIPQNENIAILFCLINKYSYVRIKATFKDIDITITLAGTN